MAMCLWGAIRYITYENINKLFKHCQNVLFPWIESGLYYISTLVAVSSLSFCLSFRRFLHYEKKEHVVPIHEIGPRSN